MMLKKLPFAILLLGTLSFLLSACSPNKNETPKIAEEQRQVLDKAKAVNDAVIQQADQQRKHIDSETQ